MCVTSTAQQPRISSSARCATSSASPCASTCDSQPSSSADAPANCGALSRESVGPLETMRWKVVSSIRDVDVERWDALAGAELTMTHCWHRVMEASRVAYQPRYLLAEDRRGPVAAIVAERNPSLGGSLWRDLVLRHITLIVSAPYSSRHCGIVLRPGTSADRVDRLLGYLAWHERRPL